MEVRCDRVFLELRCKAGIEGPEESDIWDLEEDLG